ncbi:enoyl-ACP reductase II [Polycladomyces abyssicola]|uniref:Probable nitronate monooxygenase n=1 Tax=Polycladomyces abyssicola TaxID=1125966 RepID=A0A8D5UCA2_9BACL|nr:nitronate monooxygenase [Polycladomyces abyssicola]BCU80607.1 enoyl-ACP reductase II [Polycladomyces abyssicola]
MRKNRVAEILQVRYPIIEGGMAYVGNGELAAAVSNAGGFGQVAASGRTPEDFEEQIQIASSRTDKPFGVNIPISKYFVNDSYFRVVEAHKDRIQAISLGSGDPRPYIPYFKELGLKVMVLVGSVKHAVNAEKSGADIVICEGFEAGGRNSPFELTLFSLVPQVRRAVRIPVVAAGGIVTGHGVVAAMALGAEGVQMGTRFIATKECPAHEHYKRKLLEAEDNDTVIIERSIGGVNRVLNTPYVNQITELEKNQPAFDQLYPLINGRRNRIAAIDGHINDGWLHAGQSVGLITSIMSAGEVIQQILQEVKECGLRLNQSLEELLATD